MNVKIDDLSRFSLNKWCVYIPIFVLQKKYIYNSFHAWLPNSKHLVLFKYLKVFFLLKIQSNLLCKTYLSISMHVTRKHSYTLSILGFGQVSSLSNHWSGHSLLRVHWLVRLHHPQLYLVSMVRHRPQLVTMYLHL